MLSFNRHFAASGHRQHPRAARRETGNKPLKLSSSEHILLILREVRNSPSYGIKGKSGRNWQTSEEAILYTLARLRLYLRRKQAELS